MKIHHDAERDYLSIDFFEQVEARSVYADGIIVRYDETGHVIGIDITVSMRLFGESDLMTLRDVCEFPGVSESTAGKRLQVAAGGDHARWQRQEARNSSERSAASGSLIGVGRLQHRAHGKRGEKQQYH